MKTLTALLLGLFVSSVQAEEVGYEVEIIVLEDKARLYSNSEIWPSKELEIPAQKIDGSEKTPGDIEVTGSSTDQADKNYLFEKMNLTESRLLEYVEKLKKHPDYNVLIHKMWRQTGLDRDKAFPVALDSRIVEVIAPVNENNSTNEEPAEQNINNEEGQPGDEGPVSYVDGDVTLIMSRYLHLKTNLVFHKPVEVSSNITFSNLPDTETTVLYDDFELSFERRMRSREIHYINHPMVGILVLATPFKIESSEEVESNTEYKTL